MSAMSLTDRQNENAAIAQEAALRGALTHIEREFGKGTLMRMGDPGAQVRCDAIPTGALSLDLALGIGGVPRGRIVEVFGPESSGKTTLVYHVLAQAQALGGVCAFIDAERTGPITHPGTGERDRDETRGRDDTKSLPISGEPLAAVA
jgi:RecA/RadA recombinase